MIRNIDDCYWHKKLLKTELEALLKGSPVAFRLRTVIGEKLHNLLVIASTLENSGRITLVFPVSELYSELICGGGLDLEAVQNEYDGQNVNSNQLINLAEKTSLSNIEQLAAYGLWLIDSHNDYSENSFGWSIDSNLKLEVRCILFAYQALLYAKQIQLGFPPSIQDIEKIKKMYFSENGKKGVIIKSEPIKKLKNLTFDLYFKGEWHSAKSASEKLVKDVVKHAEENKISFNKETAQRNIYDWILKEIKAREQK